MADGTLTGTRIRERRLDRGLRQADLARDAGISASYLNLIEHDRRRIGGKLLQDIARLLGVEPQTLSEGTEAAVLDGLRAAAGRVQMPAADQARVEEFASRFPGWAGLVAEQDNRISALEQRLTALADRMAHDPALTEALDDIISTVTSIRSTSAILTDDEGVDPDWQQRFQKNIDVDARRLADSSLALVSYLKASAEAEPGQQADSYLLPSEQVAAFLRAEAPGLAASEAPETVDVEAMVLASPILRSRSAKALARVHLMRLQQDARAMPLPALRDLAQDKGLAPDTLAAAFGQPLPAVLRRLGDIPVSVSGQPAGLAICDGAGEMLYLKPVAGFDLPRTGGTCPGWPLFRSLTAPGVPIRQQVRLPGTSGERFDCYAVAAPRSQPSFDAPPIMEATMLVLPWSGEDGSTPPPPSLGCPVCGRADCTAAKEPLVDPGPDAA